MARPRVVAAAAAALGVAGAHNFILHEAPLSWPDAAAACRDAGGRLAKVEDAAEQAVLATTMGSQAVWIGGSDGATEGVWAWDAEDGGVLPPSSGATQAFENWLTPDRAAAFPGCGGHAGESEPNDWGAGEDCMGAYEHCGLWFDASCADPRPYVCEHPEDAARAACPEGWRGVGGRCFGLAGSGPRDACDARCAAALPPTWPAAVPACPANEAEFAAVSTDGRFAAAYECCNWTPGTKDTSCCAWLGLRQDPDADDGWSGDGAAGWDAGCAAADRYGYDGWAAGEPNQFLGLEEDCAAFGVWGSMRWYDAPCGQSFRCLCEVELAGAAAGAAGADAAPTAAPTPRAVEAAPDASCPLVFVPAAGTWADAEATCVSLGGHLATLPDAAASAYASAHFVRARGGCRPAWIGYNDREEEGVWAWADGSVGGYERWWPGEPDDSANGARGADCASMGVDCVHGWRGVADEWVDSGCDAAGADYTPRGALCQLRALAAGDCGGAGAGAGGAGGGACSANPCPAGACAGTFTCDDAARFGYTCGMLEAAGYGCGGCACAADAAAAAAEAAWAAPDADDGEAAVVESQCHAAACGEYGSGGVDDDCCAAPDDAFCAEGYVYAAGVVGCGRGFADGRVSTCCVDPAAPAPGVDADACPLALNAAPLSWRSAEAHCVALGGHLATVPDANVARWIDERFARPGGECVPLWIGLSDATREGAWQWADGSPASWQHWWANEPDDAGGSENCASLGADCVYHVEGVGDRWTDSGCGPGDFEYRARASVCQLRPLVDGDCVPEAVADAAAGAPEAGGCPFNACPLPDLCGEAFTCDAAAASGFSCETLEAEGFDCAGCACPLDGVDPADRGAPNPDRGGGGARGGRDRDRGPEARSASASGGKALVFFGRPLAWADARAACRGDGGDLAGLRDADDQAALERVAPAAPVWVGGAGAGDAWRWSAGGAVDGFERWATADRAAATPGCGAWAGADADEPDEGAAACMAVHGGCGLWFDHPCDGKKAYVCEYADDAGGGEKGPEAAAGGGMMVVVVAVVIVLALLGGGAAAYAAKRRRGHAARGYGDVARGYEPDSDLPSYGDYVLNPISVSAGV